MQPGRLQIVFERASVPQPAPRLSWRNPADHTGPRAGGGPERYEASPAPGGKDFQQYEVGELSR